MCSLAVSQIPSNLKRIKVNGTIESPEGLSDSVFPSTGSSKPDTSGQAGGLENHGPLKAVGGT